MEQFIRRKVDEGNGIGTGKHLVRNGFAHDHARNLADHVVQAFNVLHIQRRPHVDARIKEFNNVLPPFGMACAFAIGVGEFIDELDVGLSGAGGIEIERAHRQATLGVMAHGQRFQTLQ